MNCNDLVIKEYIPTNNKIFTISYIGVLSKDRFFPQIINKLAEIPGIKFEIAGRKENMDIYNQVEKTAIKYSNVTFLGTVPVNRVIPLTMEADCVLCPLNPLVKSHKVALANKQFDAMVCGKPIICTKGTYPGDLTEKLNCGLSVDYNLDAIKEAVIKLKDNQKLCKEFGKNGLNAAKKKYNWDIQKQILLQLYQDLDKN
jgi:glycosyltransferase involved in cell wall biosynthesis